MNFIRASTDLNRACFSDYLIGALTACWVQVRRLRLQRAAEEFEDLAIVSRMIQVGPKLSHLYHGTQDVNLRKFRHRLENDLGPALRL